MTRQLYARQNQYPNLPGWTAYIEGEDDMGPDNITGFGRTEREAIADLQDKLENEDACPMCHAEVVADYGYCRSCAEVVRCT